MFSPFATPSEITDGILQDIMVQRADYLSLIKILGDRHRDTFSHETMVAQSDEDRIIRAFLNRVFYDHSTMHADNHSKLGGECMDDHKRSFEEFSEDWNRNSFNRVRDQHLEFMNQIEERDTDGI